jgi:uncharacterized protein (TIGR03437 family)
MKSNDSLSILLRFSIAPLAIGAALYGQPAPSTFQTSTANVGCNPLSVVSGDFNGDRIPDLAYTCSAGSANPIMVLLGNGDGTFHTPIAVPGPALGTGAGNKLFAADMDHDGKTDLVYIAANGNLIALISTGGGAFRSVVTTPANPNLSLVAVADLNGDNYPDLILQSGLNDSLVTYAFAKGDGTFPTTVVVPWPASATAPNNIAPEPHAVNVLTADFNGDGKPDITVAISRLTNPGGFGQIEFSEILLYTLFSNKSGGFADPQLFTRFAASGILVGDFDGNGTLDLAIYGIDSPINNATLYFVASYGSSSGSASQLPGDTTVAVKDPARAADLNGEGRSRIVFASGHQIGFSVVNTVYIYSATSTDLLLAGSFDLASPATDLIVVDLNGDGKPDIVIANTANTTIAINTTAGAGPRLTGAQNGASFAVGQPLAPGSLASLFGSGFGSATAQATTIPLPATLGNFSMTVGGIPAPLLFVSSTQVNFQVPWTVPAGPADVVATVNGTPLPKLTATIGAVEPGIFSVGYGTGQAIAINSDGSLTAPAGSIPGYATRPAKPGETIIILATGLGAVDKSIATGAAASDGIRNTTVIPTVLINGTPATVAFSGLSPQFVGVNQLNVVVPSVSAGVVSLQIDAAGVRTTDKVTIAIATQ